jgi:hypothetical protein
MNRQVIYVNGFLMGQWGKSEEFGFHVDGTSMLRFIEVHSAQVVLSEQIRAFSECIRLAQSLHNAQ